MELPETTKLLIKVWKWFPVVAVVLQIGVLVGLALVVRELRLLRGKVRRAPAGNPARGRRR